MVCTSFMKYCPVQIYIEKKSCQNFTYMVWQLFCRIVGLIIFIRFLQIQIHIHSKKMIESFLLKVKRRDLKYHNFEYKEDLENTVVAIHED